MARYLGMAKVSAAEAAKMVKDGPTARRDYIAHLVHAAGGNLEGLWLTNVGDWDLVLLLDMKDGSTADGAAATLARQASGLTIAERWIELVDVADAEISMAGLGTQEVP